MHPRSGKVRRCPGPLFPCYRRLDPILAREDSLNDLDNIPMDLGVFCGIGGFKVGGDDVRQHVAHVLHAN